MQTMLDNYINGNLKEAKVQAKRFTKQAIRSILFKYYGFSPDAANKAAYYLKTGNGFQVACDAK